MVGRTSSNGSGIHKNPIRFVVTDEDCAYGAKKPYITQGSGGILGALEKIADIEALGGATKGLNYLVKGVKAGGPFLTKLVNGGPSDVLSAVGDGAGQPNFYNNITGVVNKVSPDVANKAIFAGTALHKKIKSGKLSAKDIPGVIGDIKNVIKIIGNLLAPFGDAPNLAPVCTVPNYAMDLVNFGVKQNYRFLVQFDFGVDYMDTLGELSHAFVVKTCDRPSISIEYEDINLYNYRTRVAKKTTYNPITMTMYDDQWSQALNFYNMYLRAVSPISKLTNTVNYELHDVNKGNQHTAASTGTLKSSFGDDGKNLIYSITIYHLYRGGGKFDEYTLFNPKITEMELDQLDAEGGSAGMITATFAYDSVNIKTYQTTNDNIDAIRAAAAGGWNNDPIHNISNAKLPDDFIDYPNDQFEDEDDAVDKRGLIQKFVDFTRKL